MMGMPPERTFDIDMEKSHAGTQERHGSESERSGGIRLNDMKRMVDGKSDTLMADTIIVDT